MTGVQTCALPILSFVNGSLETINSKLNKPTFGIGVGFEYKINPIFKPELGLIYLVGNVSDRLITIPEKLISENTSVKIYAINASFCPKICFDTDEENFYLQLIPIYNYTIVNAQSTFTITDTKTNKITSTEVSIFQENRHSFGIGIGLVLFTGYEYMPKIAGNLNYANIELGSALRNLKNYTSDLRTNQTLSLELKFYFAFTKRKNI